MITDNQCYGVYADDALADSPVDATNNWWGDASGPSGKGFGTGDAVSDYVDYSPWTGFEPLSDPDQDGWPNQAEDQAGTNPYDGGSYPAIVGFYVGGPGADDNNLGDPPHPLATIHGGRGENKRH